MRVLLDARMARHSGIGRYIRNLVRALPEADAALRLEVCVNPDQDAAWVPAGTPVRVLPLRIPIYSAREQALLPSLLGRYGADLLHVPHFNVPVLYRGPWVATLHDLIYIHFPQEAPGLAHRILSRRLMRHAALRARRVIAVSEATREDLLRTLGARPERVVAIPHGAGLSHGEADPEPGVRLHAAPYFLYVGTHAPHKNLPVLLDAYASLVRRGTPADLVLAGPDGRFTGPLRRAVAERDLTGRVRWALDCADGDLATWYAHAEALVLPSLCEGFGFPILEAFGYGTPVVAARATALPEVGGDAVLYFEPDDAQGLAERMAGLLANPGERAAWGRRGRERRAAFDWISTARRTADCYRAAIGDA